MARRDAPRMDEANECIWWGDRRVDLTPKAFLVLRRLTQQPNQIVTKSALLDAAWPDTHVTAGVLTLAVNQLREAFRDSARQPRFIETVHRRGYRWIGDGEVVGAGSPEPAMDSKPTVKTPAQAPELVGRAEGLAELMGRYARAASGKRQFVLVSGEPGIGKTALVDAFVLLATVNPATPCLVGRGQCIEAYGVGDLYRPIREAIEQLLRDGGEDIWAAFRKHAPSWLLSMPELSSPTELDALRRSVITTTNETVQRELERALEAASARCPIVLVLEDLHWSDPTTVRLLWALATRREPAQLMIIGTYRSAEAIAHQHPLTRLKHELIAKRRCVDLALDGLTIESIGAYLDGCFPRHELPAALASRLHGQSAGNPLFLVNALADFEERGWLREEDGVWRCMVDLDTVSAAVPESTRELITFRLSQLPAPTRELLEAASVCGVTFATQAVAAGCDRSCSEVETEFEPLVGAALFLKRGDEIEWPDGTRGSLYEFRHALYRQVLMRGIPPARRQLLHRRIALGLEKGFGNRVAAVAGPLSLHHEQAGDAFRAVDFIELLVNQAYARSAAHEAEAMLAHAVALLKRAPINPAPGERLLKVTLAHAMALGTVHGVTSAEAMRAAEDVRALGQSMPISPEQIGRLGAMVAFDIFRGQLREARSGAEEILAIARVGESQGALAIAHLSVGTTLTYFGEIEAAIRHLEGALACIDATPASAATLDASFELDPLILTHMYLGWTFVVSARLDRARPWVESALGLARANEMPWYLGFALNTATALATFRRDLVETRHFATAVLAYGEEKNLLNWKDMGRISLGWVEVLETRDAKLIQPLCAAVDGFRRSGNASVFRMYAVLADACLSVGRIDEAGTALDAAFDTRGEMRFYDAELLRLRAMLLLGGKPTISKSAAFEQAEPLLEQAIEIANRQGARLFSLRATVNLCRLWLAMGNHDQARRRLTDGLGGFDEGLEEADLRDARMLFDEIGAAEE